MLPPRSNQRGALMIEVLVTIVIVVVGLWGLSTVQARLQLSEMESYQRAQALILLNEMASRMQANRAATLAGNYLVDVDAPLALDDCPDDIDEQYQRDLGEWCNALKGATETTTDDTAVGAMIGAGGCVEDLDGGLYRVTVVWQGMEAVAAPPAGIACGAGLYNDPDGEEDERYRRAIATIVSIAALSPP